jgi:hypothetical protein
MFWAPLFFRQSININENEVDMEAFNGRVRNAAIYKSRTMDWSNQNHRPPVEEGTYGFYYTNHLADNTQATAVMSLRFLPSEIQTYIETVNSAQTSATSTTSTTAFSVASAFVKRASTVTTATSSTKSDDTRSPTAASSSSPGQSGFPESATIGVAVGISVGFCFFSLLVLITVLVMLVTRRRKRISEEDGITKPPPVPEKTYLKSELDAVDTSVSGANQVSPRMNERNENAGGER